MMSEKLSWTFFDFTYVDVEFMATSIRQAFHLELIKLPAQVKGMPINRFKTEFDDNFNAKKR